MTVRDLIRALLDCSQDVDNDVVIIAGDHDHVGAREEDHRPITSIDVYTVAGPVDGKRRINIGINHKRSPA